VDAGFWLALTSLLIAGGGLIVAVVGYLTNRSAIKDAWAREWAAQRPIVYPLALHAWVSRQSPYDGAYRANLLPLKNGGRGPALNVRGTLVVSKQDGDHEREIVAGTIAAGDLLDAR
jgi:hypothetical protein